MLEQLSGFKNHFLVLTWEITGDGFSEILIVYWYSVIQSPCQWQLSLFIAIELAQVKSFSIGQCVIKRSMP